MGDKKGQHATFTLFKEQNAAMMLHQDGNKLVDENGNRVRLLGVNCGALEWTSRPPKLLAWVDEHEYHVTAWDFHHKAGPPLVENLEDFTPTPFWGAYYKKFLAEHNGK